MRINLAIGVLVALVWVVVVAVAMRSRHYPPQEEPVVIPPEHSVTVTRIPWTPPPDGPIVLR
jgi:hypothetical protein